MFKQLIQSNGYSVNFRNIVYEVLRIEVRVDAVRNLGTDKNQQDDIFYAHFVENWPFSRVESISSRKNYKVATR